MFARFNEDGALSSLNGKPPKFVDQFIYLGSNISSTEGHVTIRIGKPWTLNVMLKIIWKYDISNKIKHELFQAVSVSVLLYGCTT